MSFRDSLFSPEKINQVAKVWPTSTLLTCSCKKIFNEGSNLMASEITCFFETENIKEENSDGDWVMVHVWFFSDHKQLKMRTDTNSGQTVYLALC